MWFERSIRYIFWLLLVTFSWIAQAALGADVKSYTVEKGVQYLQNDSGTPVEDSNNGVIFEADVKGSGTNLITSVSILLPNGAGDALPQSAPDEFKLKDKYNKQTSLDRNFPDGLYDLTVHAVHDGTKDLNLTLAGDLYPNTPHLINFTAAQTIDAGAYYLFTWDPFAGGGSDDFVQLHIEDNQGNKVWETPDLGELDALDGRATSTLVPPRSLVAGQSYQALLYFAKASTRDTLQYPGAFGWSGYYKRTKVPVQTLASTSQADVKLYGLSKTRRFQQDDTGVPVVASTKTYNLDAFVTTGTAGVVSSVSLVLPSGVSQPLSLQSDNKTFDDTQEFTNTTELNQGYPTGTYTFRIAAATGAKSPALTLPADSYPDAPHLSAIPNNVDASLDLAVAWDAFNGGTSLDFIQLHIDDDQGNKVFETPNYGKSGALNGTATSASIPPNTFLPSHAYAGRLIFQKNTVLDTTSYPGALGMVSYVSRTNFKLTAASTGNPQPLSLHALSLSGTGSFSIVFQGAPGQAVRIENSADLQHWSTQSTNQLSAAGTLTFADPRTPNPGRRFYRGVVVP